MLYWFVELPYKLAFRVLKLFFEGDHDVLWPRHSYLTGDLSFLISDLDLTLVVDHLNREKCLRLKKTITLFRIIFPHLGEMNIFYSKILESMAELAPKLELQRDPLLQKWIKKNLTLPCVEEKYIFFAKMYSADRHNLEQKFHRRRKKWKKHLDAVGISIESELLSKDHLDDLAHQHFPKVASCDEFLIELPKWLEQQSYQKNWLSADFQWPKVENIKLLEAALSWELWGAYHQFVLTVDELAWFTHVENCRVMADHYGLKNLENKARELLETFAPLMSTVV